MLAASIIALSGCTLLDGAAPQDDPTTSGPTRVDEGRLLPEGSTDVDVAEGEVVQVALPEGSTGVGDDWGVLSVSDPAVAEADVVIGGSVFGEEESTPGEGVGGPQAFAVEVTGLSAGETTILVQYCTRTKEFTEDCDQSQGTLDAPVDPVELTVQVS